MTRARRRLLLVEDDPALQKVLVILLQLDGFDVSTAGDGQEALEMIRAERPDLVLTDLMMPQMDGVELTRSIKTDPYLQGIPVMVLTALREERERAHLISLGADAFVAKPYNSAGLTARIRELLGEA
jgi:DNA-binding response OmpR family regulator